MINTRHLVVFRRRNPQRCSALGMWIGRGRQCMGHFNTKSSVQSDKENIVKQPSGGQTVRTEGGWDSGSCQLAGSGKAVKTVLYIILAVR